RGTARLTARKTGPNAFEIYWAPLDATGLRDVAITESFQNETVKNIAMSLLRKYDVPRSLGLGMISNTGVWEVGKDAEEAASRTVTYSCANKRLSDALTEVLRIGIQPGKEPDLDFMVTRPGNVLMYRPFNGEQRPYLPNKRVSISFD